MVHRFSNRRTEGWRVDAICLSLLRGLCLHTHGMFFSDDEWEWYVTTLRRVSVSTFGKNWMGGVAMPRKLGPMGEWRKAFQTRFGACPHTPRSNQRCIGKRSVLHTHEPVPAMQCRSSVTKLSSIVTGLINLQTIFIQILPFSVFYIWWSYINSHTSWFWAPSYGYVCMNGRWNRLVHSLYSNRSSRLLFVPYLTLASSVSFVMFTPSDLMYILCR